MKCEICRSRFSELLDRSLPGEDRRKLREHLSHCPTCEKELRDLRATITLVRETPPEPPPPDLAQDIIARLADLDRENSRVLPAAARRRKIKRRGLPWMAMIASLFLAAGLGYALARATTASSRDGSFEAHRTDAVQPLEPSPEVAKLESKIHEIERQFAGRQSLLEEELREAKIDLLASRNESLKAREKENAQRIAAERKYTELSNRVEHQREDVTRLNTHLATASRDIQNLQGKLTVARRAARRRSAEPESRVRFVRNGSGFRLETSSGSLDDLVPELLAWARKHGTAPDRATQALVTLENLLARHLVSARPDILAVAAPVDREAGFFRRIRNGIGNAARDAGLARGEDESNDDDVNRLESQHERRLLAVEIAWSRYQALQPRDNPK